MARNRRRGRRHQTCKRRNAKYARQCTCPPAQLPTWCCLYSVVRTSLDPTSLAASVQRIVSAMDKDIPVTQVRTMNELMYLATFPAAIRHGPAEHVCRAGHRSHDRRTLRRNDVFRFTAYARDRRSYGAGRATHVGADDGFARCGHPAGCGNCNWRRGRVGVGVDLARACCMAPDRAIRWSWRWSVRPSHLSGWWPPTFRHEGRPKSIPWWRCDTSER